MSFNFCTSGTCQLNSLEQLSDETKMISKLHCNYHGIKRETAPTCKEHGLKQDIKDDDNPGSCRINQKRRDAEWGEFEHQVEIDTETEWKKVQFRKCNLASHGGNEVCSGDEVTVLEWYRFIHEDLYFTAAKDVCSEMNGTLFHAINGTGDQLLFFYHRLNSPISYWLGILYTGYPPKWRTLTGVEVPANLLLWEDSQPTLHQGEMYLCIQYNRFNKGQFGHDCFDFTASKAVCDMNSS